MKNVLSTGITSISQQPYTKTTHEWYNAMSKDVSEAFVKSLIPSSAYTGKLVILSGCELTGTNPGARTVNGGWAWYNGEIFRVVADTFTTTGSEIGVWSINTASTNLTFSDNASKPVHQERTFVITNGASGSGLFDETSVNVISLTNGYVEKNNINVNRIIYPIGVWDMTSTGSVSIALTTIGVDVAKVTNIHVIVINDGNDIIHPIYFGVTDPSGNFKIDSGNVVMSRNGTGIFNTSDYNGTGNRGYITIDYLI